MDFDCKDLPNILSNPQVIKKESSSSSDVIFATLKKGNVPVSIKVFLDTPSLPKNLLNSMDNEHLDVLGVKYEMKVYEYIISRITQGHYSPNFVPYIGKMDCTLGNAVRFFGRQLERGIDREYGIVMPMISTSNRNKLTLKMLVMGKAGQGAPITSLFDIWQKINEQEQYLIMFQIVYSVAVMQEFRLVHNDMHAGNVLVAKFQNPVTLYYVYKRKIFKIVTQYVPYLFDWDLSYSDLLGKNPKIEKPFYCKNRNICNRFSQKTDLYILFCTLDFEGAIAETYKTRENKIGVLTQNKSVIPLPPSPDFATEFRQNHTPIIEPDIYKMTRGQLVRAFGEDWVTNRLGNVASAMFKMYRNHMILFKNFVCRPWSFSVSMLSPKEFLESNYFDMFEVKSLEGADPSVIYRFPSRQTETKESLSMDDRSPVYMDPRVPSTRGKIVGRRRFPSLGELQINATFKQLKQAEGKTVIPRDANTMTNKHREILFKWVKNLQVQFYPTNPQIYFWTVRMIDLYMYRHPTLPTQYQKIAISAFLVVSKWVSEVPVTVDKGVYLTDNAYSLDEVREQIKDIETYFKGQIIPTDFQFYEIFVQYVDPTLRPDTNDVVEFLRNMSYNKDTSEILPSEMAMIAMQTVSPGSVNEKIRQLIGRRY